MTQKASPARQPESDTTTVNPSSPVLRVPVLLVMIRRPHADITGAGVFPGGLAWRRLILPRPNTGISRPVKPGASIHCRAAFPSGVPRINPAP